MKIINITYDNQRNLFLLTLDTQETFFLSYSFYNEMDWHIGDSLKDQDRNFLQDEHSKNTCLQKALYFASYKSRSSQEVIHKLEKENFRSKDINQALESLKKMHLIDDKRYAINYAKEKSSFKHWSKRKIKIHLLQRGLDDYNIKQALNEISEEKEVKSRILCKIV